MQITVDSKRRTARAVILVFFVLLTPWVAGAGSLLSLPEAHNANTTDGNLGGDGLEALSLGDFSQPAARENRLDRLRDMAIEESLTEGHPSATALRPFGAPLKSSTPSLSGESNPHQITGLSHAMKEAVRPTYEQAVNLGVVDAIRSVIGAKPNHGGEFVGVSSGSESDSDPRQLTTEGRTWDGPKGATRLFSPEQKAADHVKAGILLTALIEEITPWALSIVALYGLYHLAKFGRAYLRRKAGRHRRRRRSAASSSSSGGSPGRSDRSGRGRSHRHRSRSALHRAPAELDSPIKNSANSPAA